MFSPPDGRPFPIDVEVVPPAGPGAGALLLRLAGVAHLPVRRFSVATNPLARPRMSALALSVLIQQHTATPATLHVTTRDHNRLSLQGLLWGARALDIDTILAASGDYVALGQQARTTTVRDVDVYDLVRMASESGLRTGVVLDPRAGWHHLDHQVRRLEQKIRAGAHHVVTQPVYDEADARRIRDATSGLQVPVVLGILPLRTARHARFLDKKVAGIAVPPSVCARMESAADPQAEGIALARQMLALARDCFAGALLMPPFGHYEVVPAVLDGALS